MGFGLHLGYSIEGAIGSIYKIDASYLSPNVNMAAKLEEKTKDYKVALLISGSFYDYLSPEAKKCVRILDMIDTSTGEDLEILSKALLNRRTIYS
jgi:class 3 adenylate cyclase